METKIRKFLLKRLPILNFSLPQLIAICYDGDMEYVGEQINSENVYKRTNLKTGVTESISQPEFVGKYGESSKTLVKSRYVSDVEGVKWKIDKFSMFDLVICSVNWSEVKNFPKEIDEVLLIDITDEEKFFDFNLADGFGK